MTDKRIAIIQFCLKNNNACTKQDAMRLINTHYCNGEKHVGDVLGRMVKAGILKRIKPGHFELIRTAPKPPVINNPNQTNLFQ